MRQGNLMNSPCSFREFTWVTSIGGMICHERFHFATDCILPEEENNEEKIERDKFHRKIQDGLAQEEKEKEQKHPGVRPEKIKQPYHPQIRLSIARSKRLGHLPRKSFTGGFLQ